MEINQTDIRLLPFTQEGPFRQEVLHLYQQAFPDCERKPFEMIEDGMRQGKMECFVIEDQNDFAGLAFFILGNKYDILDYLAIDPARRGQNIGSRTLHYLDTHRKRGFIVEIESTLTSDDRQAHRRKQFYLANGMNDCQQPIELFGVDMELLCSKGTPSYRDYYQEMKRYFGDLADRCIKQGNSGNLSSEKSDKTVRSGPESA